MKTAPNILLLIALSFLACKKSKPYVQVHGKLVNYTNKQGIAASVELWGNGIPGTNGAEHLITTTVGGEGSFTLFGEALANTNYTIIVKPTSFQSFTKQVSMQANQDLDIGNVLITDYTCYCKIEIASATGSAIDFTNLNTMPTHFNGGTDTSFVIPLQHYQPGNNIATNVKYIIDFSTYPSGVQTNSSILVGPSFPDSSYIYISY